jgi:hypothetical protein
MPGHVFISYSHDSEAHAERVRGLAASLERDGCNVQLDVHKDTGEDWPSWMSRQLREADFILCVITETYCRRWEDRLLPAAGLGVGWEAGLIRRLLYNRKLHNRRIFPVLFDQSDQPHIPLELDGYDRFGLDRPAGYETLLRKLLDRPLRTRPEHGTPPDLPSQRTEPLFPRPGSGAPESPPASRIALSRLPVTGELLVGRDGELGQLDDAWEKANVLCVVAPGGIGKSALVNHWLGRLQQDGWRGAACVYGWSFYSQGVRETGEASADTFVAETLKWLGDPDPQAGTAHERGQRLAELVRQQRTLLVLDGIEPMQHPPGPNAGRLKDPALQALVRELAAHNPGLCVITTRETVTDVKGHAEVAELDLRQLTEPAGADLLQAIGTDGTDKERRHVAREFGGHALALSLLGKYLVEAHGGDLRKHHDVLLLNPDTDQGGHAAHVLLAYENWLGKDSPEAAYLRLLGLFDRPASADCLEALLAKPAIRGLTDTLLPLDQPRRTQALSRLTALGLVSSASPSESRPSGGSRSDASASDLPAPGRSAEASLRLPRERGTPAGLGTPAASLDRSAEASLGLPRERGTPAGFDAHPLVREHFAQRLRSSHADAYRAAHRRLYEHLTKTTEHQPDTLEGLQPLYQAVRHGCEAGLHQQACDEVYRDRILRGNEFYSTRKLGAVGADLGAVACFFTRPWRELSPNLSASDQAWLLNQAAVRLCALGRLTEALEPMRVTLHTNFGGKQWQNAAAVAGNLSELELTLGLVAEAVRDAEQAVESADRSGEWGQRMISRTAHANALHQAGRRDEARELFEQAETMQAEDQPEYPRLYSVAGFHYCDLLLAEAERAAGRALVECGGKVRPVPGSDRDAALASEVARVRAAAPASGDPSQSGVASRSAASATALQSCRAVRERAAQALEWVKTQNWLLDIALDHLTLGRVALYEAVLTPLPLSACPLPLDAAVDGLRAAGQMDELPRGLLTRAWARAVAARSTGAGQGGLAGAQADLDEAWGIAERGEMKLHMVDVLLQRVRLFGMRNAEGGTRSGEGNVEHRASNVQRRSGEDGSPAAQTRPLNTEHRTLNTSLDYPWGSPAADLAEARRLIAATGYHRRDEELADLEGSAQ